MDLVKSIRNYNRWIDRMLLNYEYASVYKMSRIGKCKHKSSSPIIQPEPEELSRVLLDEIESALLRASLTLPQKSFEQKTKRKAQAPIENSVPKSNLDHIITKSLSKPNVKAAKNVIPMHKPKVKYVPAHQKAPFKTFFQSKQKVDRKLKLIAPSACVVSQNVRTDEQLSGEPQRTQCIDINSQPPAVIHDLVQNPIATALVPQENKAPTCSLCLSEFETIKRQRLLQERQLWAISSAIRGNDVDIGRELLMRTLYSEFDKVPPNALFINALLKQSNTMNEILQTFGSVMDYFDIDTATDDQLTWSRQLLTRLFHSINRLLTTINMAFQAVSVAKDDENQITSELELWLKAKKQRSDSSPASNGYFRYYFAAGSPTNNKVSSPSRLAAFFGATKTGPALLSGSLSQARDFLRLWTELEEEIVMSEVLHAIQHRSDLCGVLRTQCPSETKIDVAAFRQLHGLLCGSTPVALKDTLTV